MSGNRSQGGRANLTGNRLERFVEHTLIDLGYQPLIKRNERTLDFLTKQERPVYARQVVIGQSIYETRLRCDFVVRHPEKHKEPLIIEAKWQEASGSIDEKYPFLVLNIKQRYPHPTVVLLDGGGYKSGAEQWLRAQVRDNLMAVFSMSEFQRWVNYDNL